MSLIEEKKSPVPPLITSPSSPALLTKNDASSSLSPKIGDRVLSARPARSSDASPATHTRTGSGSWITGSPNTSHENLLAYRSNTVENMKPERPPSSRRLPASPLAQSGASDAAPFDMDDLELDLQSNSNAKLLSLTSHLISPRKHLYSQSPSNTPPSSPGPRGARKIDLADLQDLMGSKDSPSPNPGSPATHPRSLLMGTRQSQRSTNSLYNSMDSVPIPPPDSPSTSQTTPSNKRNLILREIIDTERDYIADLIIMNEVYLIPLRDKGIFTPEQIASIFSNLDQLLTVNKTVMTSFLERQSKIPQGEDLSGMIVGDIFLKMGDYLKIYSTYFTNQPIATALIEESLETNADFVDYMEKEQLENTRVRGHNLQSFLIKPVQRICKYPLLLKELLKNTPETHPDYADLDKALKKTEDVVSFLNTKKREAEERARFAQLSENLSGFEGEIIHADRRLLLDTPLMVLNHKNKEVEKRDVLLFNDLLLVIQDLGKNKFKLKHMFPLDNMRVIDVSSTGAVEHAWTFRVSFKEEDRADKDISLIFRTEDEKNVWIRQIKAIIKEYQKQAAKVLTLKREDGAGMVGSPNLVRMSSLPGIIPGSGRNSPAPIHGFASGTRS